MNNKFHMSVDENIFLAKKILVENIYNAAKLEGVNTTYPETEAILAGVNVPNATLDDIQTIINLRDAWRYLLSNIKTAKIDLDFIKKINENVSRNESLAWGVLRDGTVRIRGTQHIPDIPAEGKVVVEINQILNSQKSATEQAIDLMLYLMPAQIFWDGNKRTASLAANAVLIQAGAGVLSVSESDIVEFNTLLMAYYDTGDGVALRKFLYDKAVSNFAGQIPEVNDPNNVPKNDPINATELKVLRAISQNPFVTYDEIAKKIHHSRKTIQRAIAELKRRDIISRQGNNKKGFWQVSTEK